MRTFSYPKKLLQCVFGLGQTLPHLIFSLSVWYLLSSGLTCFVWISVAVLQLSWEGWGGADRSCCFRSIKMTL